MMARSEGCAGGKRAWNTFEQPSNSDQLGTNCVPKLRQTEKQVYIMDTANGEKNLCPVSQN